MTGGGGQGAQGGSGGGGGGTIPYEVPDLEGNVFVGHFLGTYELHGLDTTAFDPIPASPLSVGVPTGDLLAVTKHGWVATTLEGTSTMAVFDATTLAPVAGSPYDTCNFSVALAHDDARDRLFVHCIGTVGDPTESEISVFDTSQLPLQEVAGSPFAVDVPANDMEVDPVTGRLFGVSISTAWAMDFDGIGFSHVGSSPMAVPDTGSSLAVDPMRRRVYFANRRFGQQQELLGYDSDTLAPIANSPLSFGGGAVGDIVADPTTGNIYMVDYIDSLLFSASAEPFAMLSTCGGGGCSLPPTETGLALDHELGRLFIAHIPDLNNPDIGDGFLSAWDVADPATPVELTTPGMRPALSLYPNRMSIY